MRTATRTMAAALTLMLGLAVPAFAQSDDPQPQAYSDDYLNGDYGRIRFEEGGATIVRADGNTDSGDRAGVNAPIFPGDTLRSDGRAEVQLADGTLLRLDHGTEVAFQALPEPGAKYQDNSVLVLQGGVLRIAHRGNGKDEFRIDTRDASIYVLEEGDVRIDADRRGGTRVNALRGVAEVVGNESSVLVRGGTGTSVAQGSAPAEPQPHTSFASDGFDRWCATRDAAYRPNEQMAQGGQPDQGQVPQEVQPYYNELSTYGSWNNVPTYGNVWTPSGVPSGWQPYGSGYWNYGPGGYFWVSSEPWGWAPYHYGNWQWVPSYGWSWIPGDVFAGAWVSWSWGSAYVGWAPLDYWGHPGCAGGAYAYGYYGPGSWTFVNYNNVYASNVHRYAVPIGSIPPNDLRHANVVTNPPRVDPRHFAGSRELQQKAFQETALDRSGRMRPLDETALRSRPSRTMNDIRRDIVRSEPQRPVSPRAAVTQPSFARPQAPSNGSRTFNGNGNDPWARPRRILEDPRGAAPSRTPQRRVFEESDTAPRSHAAPNGGLDRRPTGTDGVRDLYQRMSRPRETRPQEIAPQTERRNAFVPVPSREQAMPQRQQPQRFEPQRPQPQQRVDPPRPQQQPQRFEPRPQPQPQRAQPQPQRPQPRPQPERQGGGGQAHPNQGHGGGNDKHH
ncbi:MAG TPA: DUF6600 domain-containing protein [Candidatus Polarisedimenticolaceae bacterium]|nr:DUF6600 domain-containing protein [Candidatus Polarisedimenticolaceae bacterium]